MIAQNRFGGGGGGGNNRDVVFTVRIRAGDADKEIDRLGKKVDDVARRAGNIQLGVRGGGIPVGAGGDGASAVVGAGVGGTRTTGNAATAASRTASRPIAGQSEESRQNKLRAQALGALDRETDFYRKQNERAQREELAQRRREFMAIDREQKQAAGRTGSRGSGLPLATPIGGLPTKGQFGEALEGVTGLARAFVLLGVSSQENIEKAIRALAKFEAAAQGIRGITKIGVALGGPLQSLAGRFGMAAGSPGLLGAAGVAAGVGVLGAGAAIRDTINYNRTGQIGAFSQGYANIATRVAGGLKGFGIDPRQNPAWNMIGGAALLNYGGFYDASDAADAYGRGALRTGNDLLGQATYGQYQLNAARGSLAEAEMAYARTGMRQSVAMDFQGMTPGQQRRLLRRRNAYLDNPGGMRSRKAMEIYGLLGPAEQENFRADMESRSVNAGLYDRGFGDLGGRSVPPMKLDEVLLRRQLTVKLELQNDETIKRLESLLNQAVKEGNDDLEKKFGEMLKRVQDTANSTNAAFQNSQNTIGNLRGY